MLLALSIRDFAIVDALDLEFAPGFTALTGETGAGKSILIDALALALGERADATVVRAGAERAEIIAEFSTTGSPEIERWLSESALEGDPGRLLLRRLVDRNGRSRAFINGHAATMQQLRDASDALIDIHGQHAHQSLFRPEAQRMILDAHAGLAALAGEVAEAFREWKRAARALEDFETGLAAREAERERLAWQVDELAKLAPRSGEWGAVSQEQSRLAHAASLIEGVQAAVEALTEAEGAAIGSVSAAGSRIRALTRYDARLEDALALLDSAAAQIQEAAHELRQYGGRIELDPGRLAEVEARLDALHSAARKYRVAPDELAVLHEGLVKRLGELEMASDVSALGVRAGEARVRYADLAKKLSAGRRAAAAELAKEITVAMKELALGSGRFEIALLPVEGGGPAGDESVEFLVTTNPGMPARPLAKVASGGELSRLSLAIQVITSAAARVPTMIFDEVDAGIGGAVAEIVGRKMRSLGCARQVLCVTHLPQVAAQADHQWSVSKVPDGDTVRSCVATLDRQGRVEEIARMLGGAEITPTTRRHAAEMLGRGTI